MSMNWPQPGISSVGEYQVSGRVFLKYAQAFPRGWLSATTLYDDISNNGYIDFPYITQKIIITNADGTNAIRVSFASLNLADDATPANSAVKVGANYIQIADGTSAELDVKIKRLFVTGVGGAVTNIHVQASLTHIDDGYDLTQAAQDAADNGLGGLPGIAADVEPT